MLIFLIHFVYFQGFSDISHCISHCIYHYISHYISHYQYYDISNQIYCYYILIIMNQIDMIIQNESNPIPTIYYHQYSFYVTFVIFLLVCLMLTLLVILIVSTLIFLVFNYQLVYYYQNFIQVMDTYHYPNTQYTFQN